jgi:guanylate kinase
MMAAGVQKHEFQMGALVVAGPSGVGKSTLVSEALKRNQDWTFSISATTRKLRPGEIEGVSYHHVPHGEFHDLIASRGFLEYAFVFGNYYGTPRSEFDRARNLRKHLLIEVDTVGCFSIRSIRPDIPILAIVPPSLSELERRLTGRGTETPESLRERRGNVFAELQRMRGFDYVIVNDDLENAVERLLGIMHIVQAGLHHVADTLDWILDNKEITDETR